MKTALHLLAVLVVGTACFAIVINQSLAGHGAEHEHPDHRHHQRAGIPRPGDFRRSYTMNYLSQEDQRDELRAEAIESAGRRFYRCGGLWAGSELLTWVTAYDMAFNSDAYSAWQTEFSAAEKSSPRDWRTMDRLALDHQLILQRCLHDAITEIATQAVENTTEIEGD